MVCNLNDNHFFSRYCDYMWRAWLRVCLYYSMPEKYDPMKTYDPHEQYLYHCITYKALHPDEPLPDNKADTVKHMLEPLPEIARNSEHAVKLIKDLFPLTVVEKKKKKINSLVLFCRLENYVFLLYFIKNEQKLLFTVKIIKK